MHKVKLTVNTTLITAPDSFKTQFVAYELWTVYSENKAGVLTCIYSLN